jgi:hypothetical protein
MWTGLPTIDPPCRDICLCRSRLSKVDFDCHFDYYFSELQVILPGFPFYRIIIMILMDSRSSCLVELIVKE